MDPTNYDTGIIETGSGSQIGDSAASSFPGTERRSNWIFYRFTYVSYDDALTILATLTPASYLAYAAYVRADTTTGFIL